MKTERRKPGRKPIVHGQPMKRRLVHLNDMEDRMARVLGDGNLSAGIRKAIRVAYDRYQAN